MVNLYIDPSKRPKETKKDHSRRLKEKETMRRRVSKPKTRLSGLSFLDFHLW